MLSAVVSSECRSGGVGRVSRPATSVHNLSWSRWNSCHWIKWPSDRSSLSSSSIKEYWMLYNRLRNFRSMQRFAPLCRDRCGIPFSVIPTGQFILNRFNVPIHRICGTQPPGICRNEPFERRHCHGTICYNRASAAKGFSCSNAKTLKSRRTVENASSGKHRCQLLPINSPQK